MVGRIVFAAVALVPLSGVTQAPPLPPGVSRQPLVENERVTVARLTMQPGAREEVHTHPFDAVVVQLTAGTVEMTVAGERTAGPLDAGRVWFIAKGVPHAAANIWSESFDVVTVALKP
jgi:quercetin dioxygenase-like cupin family protein